ncbi:uncharacterized protein F4812DRAFT_459299 [Daldinia caldariorum]|uniref:uncharacterized protein n=1 Tax=Daldinia caldariorum TaxID=326644 RepID=UPI002007F4C0|nr:uncharacterized protein F4812DRAFT_459299 [Daldinia caldariorum]KAI1468015.1 hypothetical protein F4812DRAFT_459299 [Daldinia caldariorum]
MFHLNNEDALLNEDEDGSKNETSKIEPHSGNHVSPIPLEDETPEIELDSGNYVPAIPLEDVLPKAKLYLDVARDTPEAFDNPLITAILKITLEMIWQRLLERQHYVMSSPEFAIFNFFRGSFGDEKSAQVAVKATAIYWENTWGDDTDYGE